MRCILTEEASSKKRVRKYKCPYCDNRYIRSDLVSHVQRKHEDMIPEGYTALRVVFNYINHKDCGKCMMCEQPTAWNETKGRYETLCGREACKEAYKKMVRERNQKTYGVDDPTKDPRYAEEIQKRALANRKISGTYKFSDGGTVGYTGSYEKKLLEFLDKIMFVSSTDIISPGPVLYYQYQGGTHMYISDFLYIPYNLIIEVKDGKQNPANNINQDSRDRTVAKEKAIRDGNKYNYVRLTDNDFSQLMEVMAVLKYTLEENPEQHVVRVNESAVLEDTMNKFTLLEQASKLDPNYNKKGKLSLSSFKKIKATNSNLDNYKDKFPKSVYKYMKSYCNESDPDYSTLSYFWIDNKNDNAYVGNCSVSKYIDGDSVIHSIEINKQYRGYGLSKQILDICTKELGGFMLAVEKKNEISYKIYLSYGFIVYLENDRYYYMVLKSKKDLVQKYIKNVSTIYEGYIRNEKDIYYNKDKFDSGEINLCFITGLSGSGKSTMGRNMQSDIVEHYELDDLQCIKDHFTMDNLKEYGNLIYSYFNGPGKKFYLTYDELVEKKLPSSEYEDKLYPDFVHYAMKYANSHKNRKFVLEGVWLYRKSESGKTWFTPSEFDNYAFYIKGTSAIISKYRAAKRDSYGGRSKPERFSSFFKQFFLHKWKWYFVDENNINTFRKYFSEKIKSVSESGANAIAAAIAPWPVPYEANKDNYYMVQHLQNNVYNYSITKDPTQSEVIGIDPEKGYVVQKMKKSDIPGSYITFKLKDWEKADKVYREAVEKLRLGQCVDDTEYFYRSYTGKNILTDDQIMYDESCILIPNFDHEVSNLCANLENYFSKTNSIDLLEEQVAELKDIGGDYS